MPAGSEDFNSFDIMEVFSSLQRIVKIWKKVRDRACEWIETYLDAAPEYIVNRFLRVFESLDLLAILLSKILKKSLCSKLLEH